MKKSVESGKRNLLFFAAIAIALAMVSGILSAAPKSTTKKSARAATGTTGSAKPGAKAPSKGSSARSATGSNKSTSSARSATPTRSAARSSSGAKPSAARASTNNRRVASMGVARGMGGTGRGAQMIRNSNSVIEEMVDNPCPFKTPIQKVNDMETLDFSYFKAKGVKCLVQTNTTETKYSKISYPEMKIPAFMTEEEAWVFSCINGYVAGKQDGVDVCLNATTYCPIGEVLAKADAVSSTEVSTAAATVGRRGRGPAPRPVVATPAKAASAVIKDTKLDMICVQPAQTSVVPIAMSSVAITLNCAAGYYSAPIEAAGEAHRQCLKCPEGKTSLRGSYSANDCHIVCEEGSVVNPNNKNECVACAEGADYDAASKSCVCKAGTSGNGIGAGGCSPCPVGSYCPGGRFIEACDPNAGMYANAAGATECKYCPPNAVANIQDGAGTGCTCRQGSKAFDYATGSCKDRE